MDPKHLYRRTGTALAILVLAVLPGTSAAAGPHPTPDLQRKVDHYLAAHPGGVQISDTEISYGNGRFIVAVAPARGVAAGTADCPRGWFCFYERTGFGYPRGQLSDCGWQDLAWWNWHDRTASAHYNSATGYVVFYNHRGSDHSGDYAIFSLDTVVRADSNVSPYLDMADHVRRFC